MPSCPIFYSDKYLQYARETQYPDLCHFKVKKNSQQAILPYYVKNKMLYGLRYSGIYTSSTNALFIEYVKNEFIEFCKKKNISKAILRHHPFLPTINIGRIIKEEPAAFIDLNQNIDDIHGGFSQGHRKRLSQAYNDSIKINESKEFRFLEWFHRLYVEQAYRMRRKYLIWSHFEKLFSSLKKSLNFIYVLHKKNIIAVSIQLESFPNVFMLYGTMREEGYKKYAKHIMIDKLIQNYKKKGYSQLVLGTGVDGRGDNIFNFKKGFSKDECFVKTYEIIING